MSIEDSEAIPSQEVKNLAGGFYAIEGAPPPLCAILHYMLSKDFMMNSLLRPILQLEPDIRSFPRLRKIYPSYEFGFSFFDIRCDRTLRKGFFISRNDIKRPDNMRTSLVVALSLVQACRKDTLHDRHVPEIDVLGPWQVLCFKSSPHFLVYNSPFYTLKRNPQWLIESGIDAYVLQLVDFLSCFQNAMSYSKAALEIEKKTIIHSQDNVVSS